MQLYKSIRAALGACYLGDTKLAKALFTSPQTFDDRVLSLLTGLGQGVDTPAATAISGADLKAALAAVDPISSANRVAALGRVPFLGSARITPLASSVIATEAAADSGWIESTYFQGSIRRNGEFSWSLSMNAEFPVAGRASPVKYAVSYLKDENPLLHDFCLARNGLVAIQGNPSGIAAYSHPPTPFHPILTIFIVGADGGTIIISENRAPSLKYTIGSPCDFSCTLEFDFTP